MSSAPQSPAPISRLIPLPWSTTRNNGPVPAGLLDGPGTTWQSPPASRPGRSPRQTASSLGVPGAHQAGSQSGEQVVGTSYSAAGARHGPPTCCAAMQRTTASPTPSAPSRRGGFDGLSDPVVSRQPCRRLPPPHTSASPLRHNDSRERTSPGGDHGTAHRERVRIRRPQLSARSLVRMPNVVRRTSAHSRISLPVVVVTGRRPDRSIRSRGS